LLLGTVQNDVNLKNNTIIRLAINLEKARDDWRVWVEVKEKGGS